jgi:hypothetical protein
MIEPKPRYGTAKAIDELAKELNLPHEQWMQDWPFEVANPDDIEKYIAHYKLIFDEDKKFLLMEAIIQATTDQRQMTDFEKYWDVIKPLLTENFSIHEYSIFYWSCFETDDLTDCWTISPNMRKLWNDNHERTTNS